MGLLARSQCVCRRTPVMSVISGLLLCPSCGHMMFREFVGIQKYDQQYMQKYDGYENTDIGHRLNTTRWWIVSKFLKDGGSVFDMGCGNGAFIRSAPPMYEATGYDINPASKYHSNETMAYGRALQGYDLLTMWDVIEHMMHPDQWVEKYAPDTVIVTTPITDFVRVPIREWKHFRPDEHQHYFTRTSLKQMFEQAGYALVEDSQNFHEGEVRDPEHREWLYTAGFYRRVPRRMSKCAA